MMEEYYTEYMKLTMALIATCMFVMPALSMMPDMGQNGRDCQQQMCDRQKPEMGYNNMQAVSGYQGHEMGQDKMMSGCQGHEMRHDKMMFVCQGHKMGHDKIMFVCQKSHNVCSGSNDPADPSEIGEIGEGEEIEGDEGGLVEGEEEEVMPFEFGYFSEFIPYEFSPFGFDEGGFGEEEE